MPSNIGEISKEKYWGPNWGINELFYSNVVKRPLKLACFSWKFFLPQCVSAANLEPNQTSTLGSKYASTDSTESPIVKAVLFLCPWSFSSESGAKRGLLKSEIYDLWYC